MPSIFSKEDKERIRTQLLAESREMTGTGHHENEHKKHLPMMGVGPVYGAVIIAVTVIAVLAGNSTAFQTGRVTFLKIPLFLFYWIFMTVLMKCTEEKWLKDLYGWEYEEYCRRVNRCIPWLPGNRR